jgi:Icc-related predicted phosphoesterase
MQRFLICSGVHGSTRSLVRLRRAVMEQDPDGVLFAGGIVGPARQCTARGSSWSLSREEVLFIKRFFDTLGRLRAFSAVIPGAANEPMEEFFRLGMRAELEYPDIHVVHATLVEQGHVAFCGIGGSLAENGLIGVDSCSRTVAEYFLRPLWQARQPRKVLLLPVPPPGPLGGLEGNSLVGDLIDSYHPDLCVVAGCSDRRGVQRLGHTLVINPGCLSEGHAAVLDWDRPAEKQVEFIDLRGTRLRRTAEFAAT